MRTSGGLTGDGIRGVITSVCNVDRLAGTVTGMRLESRGRGPEVTFKAKDL